MLNIVVAAPLEDIAGSPPGCVDIRMGVGKRVAHAGLGGEVNHPLRAFLSEEDRHLLAIGDIQFLKAKSRLRQQVRQPVLFQAGIIIIVQIIDAEYFLAACEQTKGWYGSR